MTDHKIVVLIQKNLFRNRFSVAIRGHAVNPDFESHLVEAESYPLAFNAAELVASTANVLRGHYGLLARRTVSIHVDQHAADDMRKFHDRMAFEHLEVEE